MPFSLYKSNKLKKINMGFYPGMGVISTVDGELYTCHPFLCNLFKEYWNAAQASEVEFQLKRYYNLWRLSIRFQDKCTVMFLGNSLTQASEVEFELKRYYNLWP